MHNLIKPQLKDLKLNTSSMYLRELWYFDVYIMLELSSLRLRRGTSWPPCIVPSHLTTPFLEYLLNARAPR
eukprot:7360283-Heterocapsa_arctica.AAC.1